MKEYQYCAFISYRHQSPDQEIAKALHAAIETYGIPASVRKTVGKKKMGRVFRDQEELPLSSDLGADIEAALDSSEWFIAVCSPRYLESRWCLRELEYFIERKGRDHVLTVLAEGEPAESFPDLIRFCTDESGRKKETEPLAADVRSDSLNGNLKKLRGEKLRVIAPMLGLSFDDLKRRARQRKLRIISVISAIAFVVATGTASFLVINHERQEELKREAERQAQIAQEQTKLAEEKARVADEQTKLAKNNAKLAEDQKKIAEDNKKLADEQTKIAEEQTKIAEEKARVADEQTRLAEENKKLAEEQTKLAEDNAKLAEEQTKLAEDNAKLAEDQKKIAEEQTRIAEEQTRIAEDNKILAEEKQKLAEEQHQLAVSNEIGTLLEKADAYREENERIPGAETLLEALALSDETAGVRRDEILQLLRKELYFMPFTAVSGFENENVRLTDMVVSPDGTQAIGVENMNSVAVIDFAEGRVVRKVSSGDTMVAGLQYSPDGSRFLGNYCSHVTVWDAKNGSEVFTYTGKNRTGSDIANAFFWKDADTLLIQDWDRFLFISLKDGSERLFYTLGEHQEWYSAEDNLYTMIRNMPMDQIFTDFADGYLAVHVALAGDWSSIMITGKAGTTGTLVIDENGGLLCPLRQMPGSGFENIALSPDGKTAFWLSWFGVYSAWDVQTGNLLYIEAVDMADHGAPSDIVFSPDSVCVTFAAGSQLYVLDARTGAVYMQAALENTSYTPRIAYSPDGDYLILTNQSLFIIDAYSFDLLMLEKAEEFTNFTAALPLKNVFFTTRNNGTVTIYAKPEIASIRPLTELPSPLRERYDPDVAPEGASELNGGHEVVHGAWEQIDGIPEEWKSTRKKYSRDGSRAAVIYPDGAIELYDTFGNGEPRKVLGQLFMPVSAFGMVNDRLVASDTTGRLLFYDLANDRVIRVQNSNLAYTAFAFSESGDLMMALKSEEEYAIDVYRTDNAEKLFTITYGAAFSDFGFTEDGKYAVGVSANPTNKTALNGQTIYMAADLYLDENSLISQARALTSLYGME